MLTFTPSKPKMVPMKFYLPLVCSLLFALPAFSQQPEVWPGDANHDGIANQYDVIPIGLSHGASGPLRQDSSIQWFPTPAMDWNTNLFGAFNQKHSDCDGNGEINDLDLAVVDFNYGQQHNQASFALTYSPPAIDAPAMFFTTSIDTTGADTLLVTCLLYTSDAADE